MTQLNCPLNRQGTQVSRSLSSLGPNIDKSHSRLNIDSESIYDMIHAEVQIQYSTHSTTCIYTLLQCSVPSPTDQVPMPCTRGPTSEHIIMQQNIQQRLIVAFSTLNPHLSPFHESVATKPVLHIITYNLQTKCFSAKSRGSLKAPPSSTSPRLCHDGPLRCHHPRQPGREASAMGAQR